MLYVDRLIAPQTVETVEGGELSAAGFVKEGNLVSEENEPLIQLVECRICQEEDQIKNLETPCSCSGSLKVLISILVLPFLLDCSSFVDVFVSLNLLGDILCLNVCLFDTMLVSC